MADWRAALTYPFGSPERELPVVTVWVCLLLAIVAPILRIVSALGLLASVIFLLPVFGYLVRLAVASEEGQAAPFLLEDPFGLLRRGLGGFLISFVYLIVPFVLLLVTIHGAIYTDQVPDPNSFSVLTIYAGSTAVLVLSLTGAYLLPIALATYGQEGSLRAAFSWSRLRPVTTKAAYFAGWAAGLGIFAFVTAIAVGLSGVHRAAPIIATAMMAYTLLLVVHVWGRALARAR